MSELPAKVWQNIAEQRMARIAELEAALQLVRQEAAVIGAQGEGIDEIARRALEADR